MSQSDAQVIHRSQRPHPGWLDELSQIPTAVIADVHDPLSIIDPGIRTFTPGIPLFGLALTVYCAYGDNLMLHKAVNMVAPGDVIVVEMGGPNTEKSLPRSLAGEILAYGAQQRKANGMVLDALIRDIDALAELRFPVYARGVCIRGPVKQTLGTINHDIHIGGVRISPGDMIIGDRDGLVCVPIDQGQSVLDAARERLHHEEAWKEMIAHGGTSLEILGFDDRLAELGVKETWDE